MMLAAGGQINLPHTSDIISPATDISLFLTDTKIDATCNRTLCASNVMISVDISTPTFLISLNYTINNRLTHCYAVSP